MLYVGICVGLAVITLGASLLDTQVTVMETTPTTEATLAPVVLTLQAEGYATQAEDHRGQGQGRGAGRGANAHHTPEITEDP